jgi:hypothetical protein
MYAWVELLLVLPYIRSRLLRLSSVLTQERLQTFTIAILQLIL